MFSPMPLKTDFGDHLLTPFTSLFSPKGFSLSSPLVANLFEDFAVKDGHLSFDNLDSVGPSNKKKRKLDGLLATDFGPLSDSLPPAQKLCLTTFPDITYTRPVVQYGRIRAMEAEVRDLEQSIAEMEAVVEQAESQSAVMDEENRDLWATFSYLQRCLRLGHQARAKVAAPRRASSSCKRRRVAHAVGRSRLADSYATPANAKAHPKHIDHAPRNPEAGALALPRLTLPEPDLASLANTFLSPGTEELFAAACNMFLSPGKLLFTPGTTGGVPNAPPSCGGAFSCGLLPALSPLGLPVIGHKKLFAEELDLLAGGADLSGCPPCALPDLEDELFAGLEF